MTTLPNSLAASKMTFPKLVKWWREIEASWFPEDPIALRDVLKNTFWVESSKPVVRLVTAIFISAFFLVLVKNAYHQAFMKYQTLQQQQDNLHTEWMQLLIEEGTWGGYDRVNQVATTQMGMVPASPFNTQILVIHTAPDSHLVALAHHSLLNQVYFGLDGYLPATISSLS